MKYSVASLLLLAVAAQAQFHFAGHPLAHSALPLSHSALPLGHSALPLGYSAHPYALGASHTASQFHAQTELGEASFGYSHPGQAAVNYRDAFGNQVGSYAYINPEGKEVRVSYVADSNGFRVLSNALPEAPVAFLPMPAPVADTVEVAAAKAAHFAAHAAARSNIVAVPVAPVHSLAGPVPVDDTPEVKLAKAQFFAAFKAAAAAAA